MSTQRRQRGRPSAAVLTRATIAQAAYRHLCTCAPEQLRMSDLAADLGVATPSLYNHLHGKAELLNLVRDHLAARIDTAALAERPWQSAIRRWAASYISAFAPLHPAATSAIAVLPMAEQPGVMRMYEAFVRLLLDAGFPRAHVLPSMLAIESFCIGAVHDLGAPAGYMDPAPDDDVPTYRALLSETQADAGVQQGLDLLIAGMEHVLSAAGPPTQGS